MTEKIVPHIAHFSRCRTSTCLFVRNRQTSTEEPNVIPTTKCQSRTRPRFKCTWYAETNRLIAAATDPRGISAPRDTERLMSVNRPAGTYNTYVFHRGVS